MTLAQDITRHFGGEWHGTYGAFPAPGHSPSDRGVTVKDADGGRDVLFNSFNGADWRDIKDECRRLGILPEREPDNDRGNQPRETGHYEYADAEGTVLYRTVRIEPVGKRKRFAAQRPDGRGGWTGGIGGIQHVRYRLPDIIIADSAQPIYFVEGERKADKLASWGFVATAIVFGAKGWQRDYAKALARRTVIFLSDNDDTGREFAANACADLEKSGCTVHVIDLPGLPEKVDDMDWTGSAEDLRALADQRNGAGGLLFRRHPANRRAAYRSGAAQRVQLRPCVIPGWESERVLPILARLCGFCARYGRLDICQGHRQHRNAAGPFISLAGLSQPIQQLLPPSS